MRAFYFIILFFISVQGFGQFKIDPVKEELSLYPNPAKETLWVNVDKDEIKAENISVYNIIGNKLKLEIEEIEKGKFTVDVNALPAGYYLLVVENESIQYAHTVKFLKK